jgi:DNA helicase-2/ATP-dependent DNA helicase PcrA
MAWNDRIPPGSPAHEIASSENRRIRVIAGPGTGKSFAMKARVARLLEEGVDPNRILPVTFTRVAAEDLHRELVGMSVARCDEIEGITLHSLALRILMREQVLHATGRTPRPLSGFEIKPLEQDLASRHGGVRAVQRRIKAYEAAWARLQHDAPGTARDPADLAFEKDLLIWLLFHRAMLIGEVIPYLHKYLFSNPLAEERSEYLHILVDEFQDLNRAEQGVIDLLAVSASVCIVGDDDQSIYSFKHAHPGGMLEWTQINTGAHDLGLELCQRCPTTVVAMANALIAHNEQRPRNRSLQPIAERGAGAVEIIQFASIDNEVRAIAARIGQMIENGTPPGDILVLAQRGVIGTPIFDALHASGIPVKSYYAEAELDAPEAQKRFAYLKLLASPDDRVALRWLLGLGGNDWHSAAYQRLQDHCFQTGDSPWDTLASLSNGTLRMRHVGRLIARFQEIAHEVVRLRVIAEHSGLVGLIDDLFPTGMEGVFEIRERSLKVIDDFSPSSIERFVCELSSLISKPEVPSEVAEVRVMSLHKSKGLSSPVTFIAGCVEGLLPKQPEPGQSEAARSLSIDEQRRLFFVGITRVKATPGDGKPGTLILSYSQKMPIAQALGAGIVPARRDGRVAYLQASRFIQELGPSAPHPIAGEVKGR